MSGEFAGRRILVAGGAAGIGRASVQLLRGAGASVAVVDRDRWADGGARPELALQADVRDTAAVNGAVDAAARHMGALDGLIYCAGIDLLATLEDTSDEAWIRLLDINLTGAMRVCRAAIRHFAPEGGTIVLVSSGAALRPLPERSAYCASKAGLTMFAKVLAAELAPRGIRVNALCPGAVETGLFRSGFTGMDDVGGAIERVKERYALRRIAEPEEMARCILFLSSPASSYVTGTAMAADGGRTFH